MLRLLILTLLPLPWSLFAESEREVNAKLHQISHKFLLSEDFYKRGAFNISSLFGEDPEKKLGLMYIAKQPLPAGKITKDWADQPLLVEYLVFEQDTDEGEA